ncbi:hypothetical protein, partial [Butyricicoccus sp. AF35-5AC]|uniref:hypothetical protein n=1 Tax=Butyricicoccus sp. AF35-5AC TaxID=2292003 RepID=UPI001A9A604C
SLLALLTCHLLIFYRYGITACIPHVKNHTNDTLKPHRSGVPHSTDTEKRLAFSPTDKWNKLLFAGIWYNNYKAIFPTYVGVIPRRCYYGFVRRKS